MDFKSENQRIAIINSLRDVLINRIADSEYKPDKYTDTKVVDADELITEVAAEMEKYDVRSPDYEMYNLTLSELFTLREQNIPIVITTYNDNSEE